MARRIFLHVGTPKTGTTYLQGVLWANKEALQQQGLLLPLRHVRDHFYLTNIARQWSPKIEVMPAAGRKSWERMVEEVRSWTEDVLISHELFASVSTERAKWALDELAALGDEVHVIVTARDLARMAPAEWQQSVKHGRSHGLAEHYELLKAEDPERLDSEELLLLDQDPEVANSEHMPILFWKVQNLPALLHRWGQWLPPERVHLVTVPPSGAPRDLLWNRFASTVGIDPATVDQSVTIPNDSLGVVEVETLRRINGLLPPGLTGTRKQVLVRQVLGDGILTARPDARRFGVPAEHHSWVVERGARMVDQLRRLPYDVVGNLDDLLPAAEPVSGPMPEDVPDSEIAKVAVETIAAFIGEVGERENGLRASNDNLRGRLEQRTARVARLEKQLPQAQQQLQQARQQLQQARQQLQQARGMFRDERALPLKTHLRRRAGLAKRKLLRRPLP